MVPFSPLDISRRLARLRIALFVVSALGFIVVAALILMSPSQLGFVLAGPLLILPWGLACSALSDSRLSSIVGLSVAGVGLIWPLLFLI
jgi:hypothetical protein